MKYLVTLILLVAGSLSVFSQNTPFISIGTGIASGKLDVKYIDIITFLDNNGNFIGQLSPKITEKGILFSPVFLIGYQIKNFSVSTGGRYIYLKPSTFEINYHPQSFGKAKESPSYTNSITATQAQIRVDYDFIKENFYLAPFISGNVTTGIRQDSQKIDKTEIGIGYGGGVSIGYKFGSLVLAGSPYYSFSKMTLNTTFNKASLEIPEIGCEVSLRYNFKNLNKE